MTFPILAISVLFFAGARGEAAATVDGGTSFAPDAGTREAPVAAHPVISKLETIFAACLATAERCDETVGWRDPAYRLFEQAAQLAELDDAARLLWRLDVRGVWSTNGSLEDLLARRMATRLAPCGAPPTLEEIAGRRDELGDFAVVELEEMSLVARPLTAVERDDLAYFLAAVARSGPSVGKYAEQPFSRELMPKRPPPSAEREEALRQLQTARYAGNAADVVAHGLRYLVSLGYPDPIRVSDDVHGFHGPRSTFVMRDVALAYELLFNYRAAEALYRRASEDIALSGTGSSARWEHQVMGVIRTGELAGDCSRIVPERLIGIHQQEGLFGPRRLAKAGFDVRRLYAGALLTANRDGPLVALKAALEASPVPGASERLARLGPESWETRVFAVEGFADEAQRDAIPVLTALARKASPTVRWRILRALGDLAERPERDPCKPRDGFAGFEGGIGSEFERAVRPLSSSCETNLNEPERSALSREIEAHLGDAETAVQEAAVTALGRIVARGIEVRLKKIAREHPTVTGKTCRAVGPARKAENCEPYYPVRRAAADALENVASKRGRK